MTPVTCCYVARVVGAGSSEALEPLRRSIRNTLMATIVSLGVIPALLFLASPGFDPVRGAVLGIGIAVVVTLHGRRVFRAVNDTWQPIPLERTYALVALTIAMALVADLTDAQASGMWGLYTGVVSAEFLIDRPGRQAWRHIGVAIMAHLVVVTATLVITGQSEVISVSVPFSAGVNVFMCYALGTTFRQWEAALRLDEARRAAADLATTRERLRLAEDLHDILGHALEVVSLKSELAVRLSDLDPAKSKAEMVEVQRLARGALKDVRELAHGRRPTDLAIELTGARHLLESAGIACDFDADPAALTDPERELFGRILREAVTNALRHADPRTFTVALKVTDRVEFQVVNDGVPAQPAGDGTGLKGLARRVTEADGEFTAGPRDDRFEVRAVVPR